MNRKDYGEIFCKGKNVSLNATQSYYEGGGRTLGDLLDLVYPVGSIYMNVNNINPQSIFGGSWQKIEGRFLLGSSSSYSLGTTGGEANHTLTINEMPSHNHVQHHELKYGNTSWWIGGSGGTTIEVGDFNTSNTGGNQPHNNLPPYLVVNIWKRVA